MTDAFILGAGFSIAINSDEMPTTDELGKRAIKALRAIHNSRKPQGHAPDCDGISCDAPQLVKGVWSGGNFESWLTQLGESQPYLSAADNERRHALYQDVLDLVGSAIELATELTLSGDPPSWLLDLCRRWVKDQSDVITFNYDSLVEASVTYAMLSRVHAGQPATEYPVGPNLLPGPPGIIDGGNALANAPTFNLWKLHGSVTWYWDDLTRSTDSMVSLGLPQYWNTSLSLEALDGRAPGKTRVIVPPTVSKGGFFGNGMVRRIWRGAFESLRRADRVFVLGYSLPTGDLLVRSMLSEALKISRPVIWLVNPDTRVSEHYEDLGLELQTAFCRPDDPIQKFVEWYNTN